MSLIIAPGSTLFGILNLKIWDLFDFCFLVLGIFMIGRVSLN